MYLRPPSSCNWDNDNVGDVKVSLIVDLELREGCRKSKWKFKMVFAMKGGGLEGVSSATYLF